MARKHIVGAADDGTEVLPLALVVRGLTAKEDVAQRRERNRWFQLRGIDPGDWSAVYPVLIASWKVHGIESGLDRARRRAEGTNFATPGTNSGGDGDWLLLLTSQDLYT